MKAKLAVRTGLLMILIFLGISCEKEPSSPGIGPLYVIEVIPYALNVEIDSSYQFSAVGRDADMNKIENLTFTWTSKHPEVGTVDQNGLFTAISSGTTFLTAKSGTVESAKATVNVYDPVISIEIEPDSLTVYVDSITHFVAVGKDVNGNDILGLSYAWESGDTNIATVDNMGMVTGIIPGNTTVKAKLREVESLPGIVCVKAPLYAIEIEQDSLTVEVGSTVQFNAVGKDMYGNDITGLSFTWQTGDDDIATIGNEGITTGVAPGSTTVTAKLGEVESLPAEVKVIEATTGTVIDVDGNIYQTVKIGEQWWMAENLKVIHYRNGDAIPSVIENIVWENLNTGAYCEYDNDSNNVEIYGRLYNWYALSDSRDLSPDGWHVPSDVEWETLIDYLGGSGIAGGKLKEAGTEHWYDPNFGATNESGFTALPGGYRKYGGNFGHMKGNAYFWASSNYGNGYAWIRRLYYSTQTTDRGVQDKRVGFSVRLVRD